MVKIVAQLLPFLPAGEHYHIVLMERSLDEVVASQKRDAGAPGPARARNSTRSSFSIPTPRSSTGCGTSWPGGPARGS